VTGNHVSSGLLGRQVECAVLERAIAAVRDGQSRVLVVRGDPGMGKSALLAHAADAATGVRVIRAGGVESEMEFAFAALHQVCSPLLGRLGRLPVPQRDALETVFRLRDGAAPDHFLVGLAVLSLLSECADDGPLLVVIDDTQWLDRASARVLAFVARRLPAGPVGLLFATREAGPQWRGLPGVELTGLADADAHTLLRSATHARLDERIRNRIVAEAAGNPLALLELPRGLTATQMAGGFGLLAAGFGPGRIEQSFLNRIVELPARSRLLMLVAAADPIGDPDLVRGAAARIGVPLTAAVLDDTDGLLTVGERVAFRHPLVRSAVYRAAEPATRRAAHLALAELIDRQAAPDHRAWHLAAAATGPDEAVAAELERSAGRAQAGGGVAAAAAFLQRSVALTAAAGRRPDRMLAAAEASLQAGDLDGVGRLLSALAAAPLDGVQSGRAGVLRGRLAFVSGGGPAAITELLTAAAQLEPASPILARETYLTAWGMAVGVADGPTLVSASQAIRKLPMPAEPGALDLLLDGLSRLILQGRAAAADVLRRAVRAVGGIGVPDVLKWGWVAAGASSAAWDDEASRLIFARQVQVARDAGALREMPYHLSTLSTALTWMGDFEGSAAVIAEGDTVAAATGHPMPPYPALQLLSWQGREAETVVLAGAATRSSAAAGFGMGVSGVQWAAAVLYNGLARYHEAIRAVRSAAGIAEPMYQTWLLPELVEAAARADEPVVARDALDRLVEETRPFDTGWARGVEARSRALVADDGDLYLEAIAQLGRTTLRTELARAHLVYGEWLRRRRRRLEAREHLRTAYEMCRSIGMAAFAERARRELLATGETVRKRTADAGPGGELTAQERQIAQLVRDGLSNPEVGARLFLSSRTVEWHLRKIFTKLSITSRRQLREALPGRPG
jgi:DNA-binding CsgD family transcriptional regulator